MIATAALRAREARSITFTWTKKGCPGRTARLASTDATTRPDDAAAEAELATTTAAASTAQTMRFRTTPNNGGQDSDTSLRNWTHAPDDAVRRFRARIPSSRPRDDRRARAISPAPGDPRPAHGGDRPRRQRAHLFVRAREDGLGRRLVLPQLLLGDDAAADGLVADEEPGHGCGPHRGHLPGNVGDHRRRNRRRVVRCVLAEEVI